MTPSAVDHTTPYGRSADHGEGSQLGWSGRARAQRAGGDVDAESGEMRSRELPGETAKVVEFWRGLPGPTRAAYEAGPTGYGLARALQAAGIGCVVAAPGKIERPAQDKVKTDQRDAERVLRLLMIDALHPVRVPDRRGGGAARSGPRAGGSARRSDARPPAAEQAAVAPRHRLRGHLEHVDAAPPRVAARAGPRRRRAGDAAGLPRRDRHARAAPRHARGDDRASSSPVSPYAQTVARLRCLRGIDTLSAVGLCRRGRRLRRGSSGPGG